VINAYLVKEQGKERKRREGGTDVESEPRIRSPDEHFQILPLGEMMCEIRPRRFRRLRTSDDIRIHLCLSWFLDNRIIDIRLSLINVPLDIHNCNKMYWSVCVFREGKEGSTITRSFGDGETEVKSDNSWDTSETDEKSPDLVDVCISIGNAVPIDGVLVCCCDDQSHQSRGWRIAG